MKTTMWYEKNVQGSSFALEEGKYQRIQSSIETVQNETEKHF